MHAGNTRPLLLLPLLGALACPSIEPAPEDLDGLAHWLWRSYTEADDAAMADAVDKVHDVIWGDELDEPVQSRVTDLEREDLAVVDMEGTDPGPAAGLLVVTLIRCRLEAVEEVILAQDQAQKYDEAYDAYARTFTSDLEAYRAREDEVLTWRVTYEASPLPGARYRASLEGGLRYVAAVEGAEASTFAPFIVQRSWMPQPASYLDTDANVFDLDFHLEVYYERAPGEVVHFYPLWRHMTFGGLGLDTDDQSIQQFILDGFVDWDARTEELCAG